MVVVCVWLGILTVLVFVLESSEFHDLISWIGPACS